MGKTWTYREDKILEEIYKCADPVHSQLWRLPGRNEMACKNRARKLGIKKKLRVYTDCRPQLLAALESGKPLTAPDIAKKSGLHVETVRTLVVELVEEKLIHVAAWVPAPKNFMPIRAYRIGRGRNAPKPKAKTQKEITKAWEARQDPEELRVRRTGYYMRRKMKLGTLIPPRHELMTALFGAP